MPSLPKINLDNMISDNFIETSSPITTARYNFAFRSCPFGLALRQISEASNVSFSYPASLAGVVIDGIYKDVSLDDVLSGIASSAGVVPRWVSDNTILFYSSDSVERVSLVVPAPFLEEGNIRNDENLTSSLVNGVLSVSGERSVVKDYIRSINNLNDTFVKSYAVEINLFRINRSVFADISARLNFTSSNILSVSSLEEIISVVASADANFNRSKQVLSSFLYLTEGQESSLDVGTVRQRELRNISNEGYTTTSGYKEFRDGFQLTMSCSAVGNGIYILTSNIIQSKFRDSQSSSDIVPINDTSEVKSSKVLVADDRYCVLASLSETLNVNGGELFGLSKSSGNNLILVFAKVKRVNPSTFGRRLIDIIDIDSI